MAIRLIRFTDDKGRFVATVRELPKGGGFYSVGPDMEDLMGALPRWRKACGEGRVSVWYLPKEGGYDYVVRLHSKRTGRYAAFVQGESYDA